MNIEHMPFLNWLIFQYIVEHNLLYGHILKFQSGFSTSFKVRPILYIDIVIVDNVTNHSPPFTYCIYHCKSCKSPVEGDHFELIYTFSQLVMLQITPIVAEIPLRNFDLPREYIMFNNNMKHLPDNCFDIFNIHDYFVQYS